MGPDGITSFSIVQLASDSGNAAARVFFLFYLLRLDGDDFRQRPLIERKDRLATLLANTPSPLHYSDHQLGHGRAFFGKACAMSLEGTSPNAPMQPTRPAIAACGSRSSASTAKNLWWSAGPIPKARAPFSERRCSLKSSAGVHADGGRSDALQSRREKAAHLLAYSPTLR